MRSLSLPRRPSLKAVGAVQSCLRSMAPPTLSNRINAFRIVRGTSAKSESEPSADDGLEPSLLQQLCRSAGQAFKGIHEADCSPLLPGRRAGGHYALPGPGAE